MLSFFIMPVAGLILAGAVLFYDWKYPPSIIALTTQNRKLEFS
jgi:hypothetical protein